MKLVLCRNGSAGSRLLRAYMGSRWSHGAIWDAQAGTVHDTTFWQGGCKTHAEADFFAHYPDFRVIDLQVADLDAAREWLRAQDGKGYDWSALVGILFRTTRWEDDDRWFCTEECAAFINQFVARLFLAVASAITPFHLDILTDKAYDPR